MKRLIKNMMSGLAIVAAVFAISACSSTNEKIKTGNDVQYVRTHAGDSVVNSHAKMYQAYGEKERLGTIKFHETDAGLDVEVDLRNLRPGVEYKLCVHTMDGKKTGVELPAIIGTANGKIDNTYLARGITAASLAGHKIILERDGGTIAGSGNVEKGINLF